MVKGKSEKYFESVFGDDYDPDGEEDQTGVPERIQRNFVLGYMAIDEKVDDETWYKARDNFVKINEREEKEEAERIAKATANNEKPEPISRMHANLLKGIRRGHKENAGDRTVEKEIMVVAATSAGHHGEKMGLA